MAWFQDRSQIPEPKLSRSLLQEFGRHVTEAEEQTATAPDDLNCWRGPEFADFQDIRVGDQIACFTVKAIKRSLRAG
jgi:hypothetical protein